MTEHTDLREHSIYGTTIYIGQMKINTFYGEFTTYTFQDLIHKGYILAICHGDIKDSVLYTRLHSSCVTSETIRSLDCDCVSQLNGAMKKISENNGILFYLIQEGRGCGYVGKSRACMKVQYLEETDENINTFQAYEMLGMRHDYRDYTNVKDICSILEIDPEFILLTNNPDKIEKFNNLGLNLLKVESIEIPPNPFNQQYLHSKEAYGHILYQTKTKVTKYSIPYEKIEPFVPYSLYDCQRFVHVSSYYLPIKPVWNQIILGEEEFKELNTVYSDFDYQVIEYPGDLKKNYYYAKIDDDVLNNHQELLCTPYWFQVNVFYDIVTHHDYLVLKYGTCDDPSKIPIVRIHSESIFNRFPLVDREYKRRYKRSLEYIIRNGCGMIVILYNDGRGSGLGYYVMNNQKDINDRLGVQDDRRDYYGTVKLMKSFLHPNSKIDVLHGDTSRVLLEDELVSQKIKVNKWINISKKSDHYGHASILRRMADIKHKIVEITEFDKDSFSLKNCVLKDCKVYVTGIGSSEAHGRYLSYLLKDTIDIQFIDTIEVKDLNVTDSMRLILFSQGLSPNARVPLEHFNYNNTIVVTTVTKDTDKKDRLDVLNRLSLNDSNLIINYPIERDDSTLIRITGPYLGYIVAMKMAESLQSKSLASNERLLEIGHKYHRSYDRDFMRNIVNSRKIVIIADSPIINYLTNIRNKFIEGCFIDTTVCNYLEFTHGTYQFIESARKEEILYNCLLLVRYDRRDQTLIKNTIDMLDKNYPVMMIHYNNEAAGILEIENNINSLVFQLIQMMNIDQLSWPGKSTQNKVYDINKE